MSCLTHAQEVAKIGALHAKQTEAERIERCLFIQRHNAKAAIKWEHWFAWHTMDNRDLRTMIEAQETKHR